MMLERFKEQIEMERARMFPLAECDIAVEETETSKALRIVCRGQEKPEIGKLPYALFWIDLPKDMEDELPGKMNLDVLTENPKMKLRRVSGSATKIIRMLHRNFEEMNTAQAAL